MLQSPSLSQLFSFFFFFCIDRHLQAHAYCQAVVREIIILCKFTYGSSDSLNFNAWVCRKFEHVPLLRCELWIDYNLDANKYTTCKIITACLQILCSVIPCTLYLFKFLLSCTHSDTASVAPPDWGIWKEFYAIPQGNEGEVCWWSRSLESQTWWAWCSSWALGQSSFCSLLSVSAAASERTSACTRVQQTHAL